jgi:hypothetical protein
MTHVFGSELAASQSKAQILADAITGYLPLRAWRAMTYLPTTAFKIVRKQNYLATQFGRQIVREKMDAGRQGLEMNNDLFSLLC